MPDVVKTQTKMGLVIYCMGIHQKYRAKLLDEPDCSDAQGFLEQAHRLGAGGIQFPFGIKPPEYIAGFRKKLEEWNLYCEGSISLPKGAEDAERFAQELATAHEMGATVVRTVMLPGRRYEEFNSAAEFEQASSQAIKSLEIAAPIAAKQKVYLAVENHKDHRAPQKIAILQKIASEYVGACVDVGNNLSLLEDPLEVVRKLAPFARSVHFKDQALREYSDGFLLADAALGEGSLPLTEMIAVLRQANPNIHFNFEVITRDPLKVPVFSEKYWATMGDIPASDLAHIWGMVKRDKSKCSFQTLTDLTPEQRIALETHNVTESIRYAAETLKL